MTETSDLAYDISVCVNRDEIEPESTKLWGQAPVNIRPLRRLDDGSLRSALVSLPAGWRCDTPLKVAAIQQFAILSGRLRLGSAELGANAFVVVRAGDTMPPIAAIEDCELVLIQNPGQSYSVDTRPGGAIVTADVYAIEPFTPVIGGQPLHGFERRVLWIDPETGADTRMLRVPAGFRGAGGPSWHPVEEEIFCIDGDIHPDPSRPMRAGSYLWNPARSIHGFDEYTEKGCILLEWHDGPWDLIHA
ncbi:MAG: cupin domain-containing protein [Sphingopyxis sp.]